MQTARLQMKNKRTADADMFSGLSLTELTEIAVLLYLVYCASSASEATTVWRYTNSIINIIITYLNPK